VYIVPGFSLYPETGYLGCVFFVLFFSVHSCEYLDSTSIVTAIFMQSYNPVHVLSEARF
jgi:hypothetical protein